MPEDQDLRAADLILKYLRNDRLSDDELEVLESWKKSGNNNTFFEKVTSQEWIVQRLQEFDSLDEDALWQKIAAGLPTRATLTPRTPNKIRVLWRYAAAASVVLMLSVGAYFWFTVPKKETAKTQIKVTNDIAPGKEGAILTLADGKQIVLDTAANGSLTEQGGTQVIKMNGSISYDADASPDLDHSPIYHTISTPKGRTFQVVLADGSRVWLNAGSSLYYATAFTGKERKVTLTGEAYFEVEKNVKMPFIVTVKGAAIKVTGTRFNVNAYDDERSIKATLLEGSVQVAAGSATNKLAPGQQAEIPANTDIKKIAIKEVDTNDAVDWKNGLFFFNNENIKDIMRRLSRWYEIEEVVYEGNMENVSLGGTVFRSDNISTVLKKLELTKAIHFKIDGRKVIVSL